MDNSTLIVLPSARAIRHEQLSLESQTLFLPNYITMSEFISRLCLVKSYSTLEEDSRILLLLEASDFKAFSGLKIQRNFFTFTKNASYIFKFFEELSAEMYDIRELKSADIYAEFEEHISVLEELYIRYENLCNERKLLDKIFLPKYYEFNASTIQNYKTIELYVDGYLTNFELSILEKCTHYCEVILHFQATKYNLKMQSKFESLGFEIEKNTSYKLNLNTKQTLFQVKLQNNSLVSCESFSESLLQIGFIKQKVYEFIQKGYEAEKIAVILPDETLAEKLKTFDDKSNFNFAMGETFTHTPIYTKLHATYQALEQNSKENFSRLDRVSRDMYDSLKNIFRLEASSVDVVELLQNYKDSFTQREHIKIYEEELYRFKTVLPFMEGMQVKSLLSLFLQRLAKRTIDDIRGGKVTVMGVLETRSIQFDAVIIVDFSDMHVPKRSNKDMFLNTQLREIAKLPTMNDRENLQKHYYYMLMQRSKEVAISYVESLHSDASKFLKQLGITSDKKYDELNYANILFDSSEHKSLEEEKIIQEYSFKNVKISATRLKTFFMCKRKYFYKYIQGIKSHEIPKDMPREYEIGQNVHDALKNLYSKKNSYDNVELLQKDLHKELDAVRGKTELESYLIDMQKKRLESFCELEISRFNNGWVVDSCEKNLECKFAGATLIGQIDRIDRSKDGLYVLDYKTGSFVLNNKNNYADAIDFQLEFYYLLANEIGEVRGCGFYDLKNIKIEEESFLEEKLLILEEKIKELLELTTIDFELCEDRNHCKFCEYKLLCNRG